MPKIVAPDAVLRDGQLSIRITDLQPGKAYAIRGEFASHSGTIWRSEATFRADAKGAIEPATTAPDSGSYSGVEPYGILWSMQNTKEHSSEGLTFENDDYAVLKVIVLDEGKSVTERYLVLRTRDIGVSTTEIRNPVNGTFLSPYNISTPKPAVIVLGGSEGGTPRSYAALIASHGFPTLSLSYFGADDLPKDLEKIPVETVERAVDWLARQRGVDPKRIIVLGMSKGAELALLAAANDTKIHGVIAVAPASAVFEAISNSKEHYSSWTIAGREVPYAPYVSSDEFKKSHRLVDLYLPTLDKAPKEAQIPVERIVGPILLISGKADALWPSARMSDSMEMRLKGAKFRFPVTNLQFDDAGHHVARVPMGPTADSVRLGGSSRSIFNAQLNAWHQMINFLDQLSKK